MISLDGWMFNHSIGTTLQKGFITIYYDNDCNGKLFANLTHEQIPSLSFKTEYGIKSDELISLIENANDIHEKVQKIHNSKWIYRDCIIKIDMSDKFRIKKKGCEMFFMKFESIDHAVSYITKHF